MGMKNRVCDVCGKRKRFDPDRWYREGWVGLDADGQPCPLPTEMPPKGGRVPGVVTKACPHCARARLRAL